MKYPLSPEALADAAKRNIRHMELDDLAAMKVCLLSTGALLGLSCKGRLSRRLMGLTCSFLAAGLAIPLTNRFLDELKPGAHVFEAQEEQGGPETESLSAPSPQKDPEPLQTTE